MRAAEKLAALYAQQSKHSNYQVLPLALESILGNGNLTTKSRFERQRLDYILSKIQVRDKSVLDIGGNTGFFSFEVVAAGANTAQVYEGNAAHCEFVTLAAEVLGSEKVSCINRYYDFPGENKEKFDVALLLNVLHHVGDDYFDSKIGISEARLEIIRQLNSMSSIVDTLVFQLGFNWRGDSRKPLFENGTKKELIKYVSDGVSGFWRVSSVGVAVKKGDSIVYEDLNSVNVARNDSLGEFLNRPIFILEAIKK